MSSAETTPLKLDLKRDRGLTVTWSDGRVCEYSLSLLRTMCPCALCKSARGGEKKKEEGRKKAMSLTILPGNFSGDMAVTNAELVGNYAIRLDWSDGHSSGIYSFEYLRSICP